MNDQKIRSMLSLGQKAGKIRSGEFMSEKSIRTKEALLVIIACDASEKTKENFKKLCTSCNIPLYIWGTKKILGCSIGKGERASLTIIDPHFTKRIEQLLEGTKER